MRLGAENVIGVGMPGPLFLAAEASTMLLGWRKTSAFSFEIVRIGDIFKS